MVKAKSTLTVAMGAYALKIKKAPGRGVYVRAQRLGAVSRWVYIPGGTVPAATAYPWAYWEVANDDGI